jgi:hypothetical protein
MRKLLLGLISIALVTSIPNSAHADTAYNQFKKTQMAEFKGDKAPEKCPVKKLKANENENETVYELCAVKGKPIFIRASSGGVTYGFYEFKAGKLIQVTAVDAFVSTGYRNEQPVVQWDYGKKTVNLKLSAKEKSQLRQEVINIKGILKKFGIRK